jgi:hypothetical protein
MGMYVGAALEGIAVSVAAGAAVLAEVPLGAALEAEAAPLPPLAGALTAPLGLVELPVPLLTAPPPLLGVLAPPPPVPFESGPLDGPQAKPVTRQPATAKNVTAFMLSPFAILLR